jgi:hypothetical protein
MWKCHKDNSCIAILNKQEYHFFFYKTGEQESGSCTVWGGWYQWEGRGYGERVWEGEYGANTVYTCM